MRYKNFKIQIRSDSEIKEDEFYDLECKIECVINSFRKEQEEKGNHCLGEVYNIK